MWQAVLGQIVFDIVYGHARLSQIQHEIRADGFETICDLAGFETEAVRSGLKKLIAQKESELKEVCR